MIKDPEFRKVFDEAKGTLHLTPAEHRAAELFFMKGYAAGVEMCAEKLRSINARDANKVNSNGQ